ncbi:MAG: hypothetical protein U0821_13400 [Chloroflexota bacterium]
MHPLVAALYAAFIQYTAGSLLAMVAADWRSEVTPGFLRLAAVCTLPVALLAYAISGSAPPFEQTLCTLLVVVTAVLTVLQFGGGHRARMVGGTVAVSAGLAATALAAMARPNALMGPAVSTVVALASAVAVGAGVMAMILGHWYLMTPRLTPAPLRRLCDLTIGALVILTIATAWFVLNDPQAAVIGPDHPVIRWGAPLGITVLPLGVTAAARICCKEWPRGRAIQAATGLLYVTSAIVLAGVLAGNMVLLSAG